MPQALDDAPVLQPDTGLQDPVSVGVQIEKERKMKGLAIAKCLVPLAGVGMLVSAFIFYKSLD